MAEDYGIKITKAGYSATDIPTSTTKKNYTILSTDAVNKVSAQAVVSADTNVEHGLGFAPLFDSYILSNSLSEARASHFESEFKVNCDSTYLYCDELYGTESLFYIIYLEQP